MRLTIITLTLALGALTACNPLDPIAPTSVNVSTNPATDPEPAAVGSPVDSVAPPAAPVTGGCDPATDVSCNPCDPTTDVTCNPCNPALVVCGPPQASTD